MEPLRRLASAALALALIGAPQVAHPAPPRADWGLPALPDAPRPWLGISITELEGETGSPGLTLARVVPDGPAARAGLQPGDVLFAVDGTVLQGAHALKAALSEKKPGETLKLIVLRKTSALDVVLTLGAAPKTAEPEQRMQPVPAAPAVAAAPPAPAAPVVVRLSPSAAVVEVPARAPAAPAAPMPAAPGGIALAYLGDTSRPTLGIDTMDLEPGLAGYFHVKAGEGVLVESVAPGSPASRVGVAAGDVLVSVAGKPIGSGAQLVQELRGRLPGERVALALLRDGRRIEVATTLERSSVPEWRIEPSGAGARGDAERKALHALADHEDREIAKMELLLAAQEEGQDVDALLSGASGASGLKQDAESLKKRLAELQAQREALRAQLQPQQPQPPKKPRR